MDEIKKYWPYAVGAVIVYFVYTKYMGGSSASASGSGLSAMIAAQQAASNQAAQIGLSQQNLAAQQEAAQNAASVAATNASAGLATATGSALSQIIAAQSAIPAMAINAASANNQTALQASAQLAETAYSTLPQAMNAQANQIVAVNQQFGNYLNASTNLTQTAMNSTAIGLNAVGNNSMQNVQSLNNTIAQNNQSNNQLMQTSIGLGMLAFSDERLKSNIKKIGKLGQINLYSWTWNDKALALGLEDKVNFGVIAQDVMHVYPDCVSLDESGYFKVDYRAVITNFGKQLKAAA